MRSLLSATAGTIIAVSICAGASAGESVVVHSGDGNGQELIAGVNDLDVATVNCPVAAGCVLVVSDMVQVDTKNGDWAICPRVDDKYIDPPCPAQGIVDNGSTGSVTGHGESNSVLKQGLHNLSTRVQVSVNSGLYSWQVSYLVYWLNK